MKKFLALLCAAFPLGLLAQTAIPNGNFESWTAQSLDIAQPWHSSNEESMPRGHVQTFFKETTKTHGGSGAVKLMTTIQNNDTFGGYVLYGPALDPQNGRGGLPYAQRPDSIVFYYQYSRPLASSDSGLYIVVFKKAGNMIGFNYGTLPIAPVYTRFSKKMTYIIPTITPDTVIIGFASSNLLQNVGVASGSTLYVDDISFVGGSATAVQNGNFETWTTVTQYLVDNWYLNGDPRDTGVTRVTDHYRGSYAVKLMTTDRGGNNLSPAGITTGQMSQNGPPRGGRPYTKQTDTLIGWYKYNNNGGTDKGQVSVILSKQGNGIGGNTMQLSNTGTWTSFSMPFTASTAPDSIRIDIQSANYPPNKGGSTLIIDEVQLKSQPLSTPNGIHVNWTNSELRVYPNPAQDQLFMILPAGSGYTVQVYNALGQEVWNAQALSGTAQIKLNGLKAGIYLYKVHNKEVSSEGRFIKN